MTCRISLSEDRLILQAAFILKEACKAIPGARWNPIVKAWTYPATPGAAKSIHQAFPNGLAVWTDEAAGLLLEAEKIAQAAAHKSAELLPLPEIHKTVPWLHQLRAYHFCKALPAAMLAMDMGTGKSKVTIDLILNRGFTKVLILCPKSVVAVWPMEFEKHADLPYSPTIAPDDKSVTVRTKHITQALDLAAVRNNQLAVVVVNYDAAWREPLRTILLKRQWDCVVCDESHRIKAPGGKASLFCSQLGDHVPYRMCLTGTPLPHSPMDAYAQYRFLDKGIYGTSFTLFRSRFAVMGGYQLKQVVSYQNQDDFHEKFYSIAYRVKSEDVLSLPDAVDVVRPVHIGKYARSLYTTLKKEFVVEVGAGRITAGNALTRLLRLQQLASGWAREDTNVETGEPGPLLQVDQAKQDVLADLLEDCHDDEPCVVFCRFHHDLDAVHTVAAALGRSSLELSGRRHNLKAWQSGEAPILAVQIQSGGVGIDLTRARYCVFFSLGFSLGEYLQARKRIHRPGQQRACTYFHLIATQTVDQEIYRALQKREDVVESILRQAKAA